MKQFLTSCFALCTPRFIILKVNEPATVLLNATGGYMWPIDGTRYRNIDNALCTHTYIKIL
jgi:hypothetical protein